MLTILSKTDTSRFLIGGMLAILAYNLLRSLRWWVLLRVAHRDIRFPDLYFATAVAIGLAAVTPAQAGEAIKVEMLKKQGILERLPGYGSFVIERLADLLVVFTMAAIGVMIGPPMGGRTSQLRVFLPTILVVLFLAVLALNRLRPGGAMGRKLGWVFAAVGRPRTLVIVLALSVAGWLMIAAGWWVSLESIGLHTSAGQVMLLVPLVALARILSFLPGGLGISEVLSAEILTRMGHPTSLAQAGSMIIRCYSLLVILNGVFHIIIWRLTRPVPQLIAVKKHARSESEEACKN